MKRHAPKLILALLFAVFVATLWIGADWLGRVRRRANTVETRANELDHYLDSLQVGLAQVTETFRSGEILSAIQQEWGSGIDKRDFPAAILRAPGGPERP